MNELEQLYLERLENKIMSEGVSNEFLVSLLKLSCSYLNLQRVSDYSKKNKITTQGLRKYHKSKIIKISNMQFVIDND